MFNVMNNDSDIVSYIINDNKDYRNDDEIVNVNSDDDKYKK